MCSIVVPDARYVRKELPITDIARVLGLEPQARRLRCPVDRSHWANLWLRKNAVKCFVCGRRPWTTIDLVIECLGLGVGAALEWLAQRFDIPKRWVRVTTNRHGLTRHHYVDYPALARRKSLEPSVASLRRAPGWPELSHGARLLAPVLLEIIPKDTLVGTTTQEELRRLAGIANRSTARNALRQLEHIGLVATVREAVDREPRSGRFTTALGVRLTWASPTFQDWLSASATQSRCSKLNTVKSANRHENEHGAAGSNLHVLERVRHDPLVQKFLKVFDCEILAVQDLPVHSQVGFGFVNGVGGA